MKIWFLKKLIGFLGGYTGPIYIAMDWFNESVLDKITDADEYAAYCKDVVEFGAFLEGVFDRHQKWMSDAKREAATATIGAVSELAVALSDRNVTKDEIASIVKKVKEAIDAWKKAK